MYGMAVAMAAKPAHTAIAKLWARMETLTPSPPLATPCLHRVARFVHGQIFTNSRERSTRSCSVRQMSHCRRNARMLGGKMRALAAATILLFGGCATAAPTPGRVAFTGGHVFDGSTFVV